MKILKSEIDWMKGFANLPTLKVWVDRLPSQDELVYQKASKRPDATSYYAAHGDYVNFFTHTSDEHGYGGRVFTSRLEDGSQFAVKGPWSDSSLYINTLFPPCHEVVYYETEGRFPTLGYAGAMKMSKFIELVEQDPRATVVLINNYGGGDAEDGSYTGALDEPFGRPLTAAIKLRGMTLSESQREKNK